MGTLHPLSRPLAQALEASSSEAVCRVTTASQLVLERRHAAAVRTLATAAPALDELLGGGLERGALTELVGRRSSGRFAAVNAVLAAVTSTGREAALVDLGDGFDPRAAAASGVCLERLLWVRPRRMKEVLACAEAILGTGMPLLVIELGTPPVAGGRGVEAAWLRLARAARVQRTALFVSSPYRVSGTAAQVVVEARGGRPRWQGRGREPRLLQGVEAELVLVKSRRRQRDEGSRGVLGWRLAEAAPLLPPPMTPPAVAAGEAEKERAIA